MGIFGTPVVGVCEGAVVEVVDDVVLVELVDVVAADAGVVGGAVGGVVGRMVGWVVVTGTVVVVGRVVVVVEVVEVSATAGVRGANAEMTRPSATAVADATDATERGDGGKVLIPGGPEASGARRNPSPAGGEASTGLRGSRLTLLQISPLIQI